MAMRPGANSLPSSMVVSNLPYSVSSKITFRLLDIGFTVAVLMFQEEFARRMVAPAGTKDCGRLSIMVQTYAAVQQCFTLPPTSFSPKPQVHSMVVKITPRPPIFGVNDKKRYADVVRALFTHRRKTVRNGIGGRRASSIRDGRIAGYCRASRGNSQKPSGRTVPGRFCNDRKS